MRDRALTALLALALIAALTACTGGAPTSDATATTAPPAEKTEAPAVTEGPSEPVSSGESIFGKEPLTITWYVNYDWYAAAPWADQHEGERWIKENMLLDIQFVDAGGAAAQKFATMILDDSFPDVITVDRDQNMLKLIDNNLVVPLDSYMNKYTNLTTWIDEGTINMLRAPNGGFYSYPNWAIGPNRMNGNKGWAIDRRVYESLGSPKLETYDDLYDYLKMVKESFPDYIPLETGPINDSLAIFYTGMADGLRVSDITYGAPKDGRITSIYKDENYRNTLLYLNKLFREKLLAQDVFTENNDQYMEKIKSCKVAVIASDKVLDCYEARLEMEQNGSEYVIIQPIRADGVDLNKVYNNTTNTLGWNVSCISKDAKSPESIYAALDWLFGAEGQRLCTDGPPGKYFAEEYTAEGYPTTPTGYLELTFEELNKLWSGNNWVGNTSFIDGQGEYFIEKGWSIDWVKQQQTSILWKHSADVTDTSNFVPDLSTDVGMLYQTMVDLDKEIRATVVMAATEDEAIAALDRYVAELDAMSYNLLLDHYTEVWLQNLELLGW